MKERKRKITIITVIGVMLILAITTFTYAIWSRTHIQTGINKNTYACFDISYEETNGQGITMENGFPQTDEQGMKNDAYEVQIENTCDTVSTYNVILNKQESSNLDDTHLKVAVDNDYKLLSQATPTDKRAIEAFQNDKSYIIGTGVVGPKQTKIVQIRSWMDKDTTEDEGENKRFTFKITIETGAGVGDLKTKIFGKEYAVITETPDFSKGFPNSSTSEEEVKAKSGLYLAFDDDGDSYYFRGDVKNNYVKLSQDSEFMWRILRVNGNGSVRLILNDKLDDLSNVPFNDESCNEGNKCVGYTYDNNSACTNEKPCTSEYKNSQFINSSDIGQESDAKQKLEEWYQNNLVKYDNIIELATFCNDSSYFYGNEDGNLIYGVSKRWSKPSLLCPNPTNRNGENRDYGGVYKLKIGLATADELTLAGLSKNETNSTNNYLNHNDYWWSMTPSYTLMNDGIQPFIAYVYAGGIENDLEFDVTSQYTLFPVINLKSDVTVTGSGTQEDPYVVE